MKQRKKIHKGSISGPEPCNLRINLLLRFLIFCRTNNLIISPSNITLTYDICLGKNNIFFIFDSLEFLLRMHGISHHLELERRTI